MLERAAAALKANEAAALNEFNDKHDRRFHDRDLYVFCNTLSDGKMTAHPNHKKSTTPLRIPRREASVL